MTIGTLRSVTPDRVFIPLKAKYVAEAIDYRIDLAALGIVDGSTTVLGITARVAPSGAGELSIVRVSLDADTAVIWTSGGQPRGTGSPYLLNIEVSTNAASPVGRVDVLPMTLPVLPLLDSDVPQAITAPGFGTPVIWDYGPSFDFSIPANSWLMPLV